MRPVIRLVIGLGCLVWSSACGSSSSGLTAFEPEPPREPCAQTNPLRNAYYGDLHVHTALSFDAYVYDVRTTPNDAYRFAKGEPIGTPPLNPDGVTYAKELQLETPLDFVGLSDHSELLAEVRNCLTDGATGFDTAACETFREGGGNGFGILGGPLATTNPARIPALCGDDGMGCTGVINSVWGEVRQAAIDHYDRTSACTFTTLVGYEWTGTTSQSNLHRNVFFRSADVPTLPVSYFDAPTAAELYDLLDESCGAVDGCDVLAIPHNSNLSNGRMFRPVYPDATTEADERAEAEQRARLEPLAEITQHKAASECFNGLSGIFGPEDELCEIETSDTLEALGDCGDGIGSEGLTMGGCVSSNDFLRGALLTGLAEEQRLGVNPFRLGFIASTDTHMSIPGATVESEYIGHVGDEVPPEGRLSDDLLERALSPTPSRRGPGGLAGAWAPENTREAIFDAFRRRETFGTSGTRIAPRMFGAWELSETLCDDADLVATADAAGVPMGGVLSAAPSESAAPTFVVAADRDPSTTASDLQQIQIIKGWVTAEGEKHFDVFTVAGDAENGASVSELDCSVTLPETPTPSLCGVWTDPDFDPALPTYYYARIVENPTCRWHWQQCLALPEEARPEACTDEGLRKVIQEMAWTSPIWYSPPG